MEVMARAVALIQLALPTRAGVVECPIESSRESSRPESVQPASDEKRLSDRAVTYEHPIELPQFRHL